MRIDDVKVGEEYQVTPRRWSGNLSAKRVKVLGIETVEEKHYARFGRGLDVVKRRKIRVQQLDADTGEQLMWTDNEGPAGPYPDKLVGGADLEQPWANFAEVYAERRTAAKERDARIERVDAALRSVGIEASVSAHIHGERTNIRLSKDDVDRFVEALSD